MSPKKNTFFLIVLIALVAATRLFPNIIPPNVSPLAAIALFGSAYFGKKHLALLIPFGALFLSDLFLNNMVYSADSQGFTWFSTYSIPVYFSFLLIVLLGFGVLQKITTTRVLGGTLMATAIFFLITNFTSMLANPIYSKDLSGLLASYKEGLPFLRNSLLGNLFYSSVLFGIYHYATSPKTAKIKA